MQPKRTWTPPSDHTGKARIIVWHQRPDTNDRLHGTDHTRNMLIREWPANEPFPHDRGTAYAYQVGVGFWRQKYGQGPKQWSVELESLTGMVYFGEPRRLDDGLYCEDDHGELRGPLEDGDSIEPIEKGITISHAKGHEL